MLKFLYDEKANGRCARMDFKNKLDSPNDGYRFSTSIYNVWHIVSHPDLFGRWFLRLMQSYEMLDWYSVEIKNERFRRWMSNVTVHFVVRLHQEKDGFRSDFKFDTFLWRFKKSDSIVVGKRGNWGKEVCWRQRYWSNQHFFIIFRKFLTNSSISFAIWFYWCPRHRHLSFLIHSSQWRSCTKWPVTPPASSGYESFIIVEHLA